VRPTVNGGALLPSRQHESEYRMRVAFAPPLPVRDRQKEVY